LRQIYDPRQDNSPRGGATHISVHHARRKSSAALLRRLLGESSYNCSEALLHGLCGLEMFPFIPKPRCGLRYNDMNEPLPARGFFFAF
jgi:hypothetical protein